MGAPSSTSFGAHCLPALPDFVLVSSMFTTGKAPQKIHSCCFFSQISNLLKPGKESSYRYKGPIGSKGARLTGQISIPGKYLVLFPNKSKIAISRKIYSQAERGRIRGILSAIKDPNYGIIVRTEAEGCEEEEFKN
jgi:ribonuclease G